MRIFVSIALVSPLLAAIPAADHRSAPVLKLEFRAGDRERPSRAADTISLWSFHDHSEWVQVVVRPAQAAMGAGDLFTEVGVDVARIVWENTSKETPNYEATIARAYRLPAIARSQIQVSGRGPSTGWVVATVKPDDLSRQLDGKDPELLVTALWARSCYVGRGGASDGKSNCTQRKIELAMAD